MVYEKQADGTFRIESVPFSNGRFVASHTSAGTSFDAQRHLTDHLGSVRCIVNSAGLVIEMNDYTPFGERFNVPSYPRSSNRYLFNGKEEVLAGLLDYGARIYDPYTRRWLTQDPLAEMYYGISPYAYCLNNPVNYVDRFGLFAQRPVDLPIDQGVHEIEAVDIFPNPYKYYLNQANIRAFEDAISQFDGRSVASKVGTVASSVGLAYDTRVGSNGKLYFRKPSGRIFEGGTPKKIKVYSAPISKTIGKAAGPIGAGATVALIVDDGLNGNYYQAGARITYGALNKIAWGACPLLGALMTGVEIVWGEDMYEFVQNKGEVWFD